MLTRILRRLRSALLGLLGRCEFCGGKQEKRHLGCLYCNDMRYCHRCLKTFYFASLYGYRW